MRIKPHPMTMRFDQLHLIDLNGEVIAATVDPNGDGLQLLNFVCMRYNMSADEFFLELLSSRQMGGPRDPTGRGVTRCSSAPGEPKGPGGRQGRYACDEEGRQEEAQGD